jgi:hypothetical protein
MTPCSGANNLVNARAGHSRLIGSDAQRDESGTWSEVTEITVRRLSVGERVRMKALLIARDGMFDSATLGSDSALFQRL